MRMLPDETEVGEDLEADDRQVQLLNLGFFGRSPAEIVGSNPTRGMDICLL